MEECRILLQRLDVTWIFFPNFKNKIKNGRIENVEITYGCEDERRQRLRSDLCLIYSSHVFLIVICMDLKNIMSYLSIMN